MKLVKQNFQIIDDLNGERILRKLERIGRLCYKSEERINDSSYKQFLRDKIDLGHESIIEHEFFTVLFTTDRGVTHEIVRHRLASYTQESTRYCNYTNEDKFDGGLTFIDPAISMELCPKTNKLSTDARSMVYSYLLKTFQNAETTYNDLVLNGVSPQIARGCLPTDLKAEIYMTANLREWRHFFKMRTSKPAHPKMKELTIPLLFAVRTLIPIVFDDIDYDMDSAKVLFFSEDKGFSIETK